MRDKKTAVSNYIADLHMLFKQGRFRSDTDLYKYIVNLLPTSDSIALSEEKQKIHEFQDYLEELKKSFKDQIKFLINCDVYWTFLEVEFEDERTAYQKLVKIYAPVEYPYLTTMARYLFDYLYGRQKFFCFKIAHSHRLDNICIWVTREEFENTSKFLQTFIDELLPAPIFCPEHLGIGVSRELSTSLNYIISKTLYRYFAQTEQTSLAEYVDSVHKQMQDVEYYSFDREIVLRSLMCILNNQCPIQESIFSIVDYTHNETISWK